MLIRNWWLQFGRKVETLCCSCAHPELEASRAGSTASRPVSVDVIDVVEHLLQGILPEYPGIFKLDSKLVQFFLLLRKAEAGGQRLAC